MPITWNDEAHAKLLVAILHTTNVKLDFAAIANYMGPGCTMVAIRLHIQQLKRQVAEASGSIPAAPKNEKRNRTTHQSRRRINIMQRQRELKLEESPKNKVENEKGEDIKDEDEKIKNIKEEVMEWMD